MSYKAQNWNALSHEQYFLTPRFLDIPWVFKKQYVFPLRNDGLYSISTFQIKSILIWKV